MTFMKQPVLVIEDNRDDIFLMERAVGKSGVAWELRILTDGQQALDYFSGAGEFSNREKFPLPAIIFLDLKLPYVTGFEVMAVLRNDPVLRKIPVVILTSSPEERDQYQAMNLGAKAYMTKPPSEERLREIASNSLDGFQPMGDFFIEAAESSGKAPSRMFIFTKSSKSSA